MGVPTHWDNKPESQKPEWRWVYQHCEKCTGAPRGPTALNSEGPAPENTRAPLPVNPPQWMVEEEWDDDLQLGIHELDPPYAVFCKNGHAFHWGCIINHLNYNGPVATSITCPQLGCYEKPRPGLYDDYVERRTEARTYTEQAKIRAGAYGKSDGARELAVQEVDADRAVRADDVEELKQEDKRDWIKEQTVDALKRRARLSRRASQTITPQDQIDAKDEFSDTESEPESGPETPRTPRTPAWGTVPMPVTPETRPAPPRSPPPVRRKSTFEDAMRSRRRGYNSDTDNESEPGTPAPRKEAPPTPDAPDKAEKQKRWKRAQRKLSLILPGGDRNTIRSESDDESDDEQPMPKTLTNLLEAERKQREARLADARKELEAHDNRQRGRIVEWWRNEQFERKREAVEPPNPVLEDDPDADEDDKTGETAKPPSPPPLEPARPEPLKPAREQSGGNWDGTISTDAKNPTVMTREQWEALEPRMLTKKMAKIADRKGYMFEIEQEGEEVRVVAFKM